MDVDDNEEKEYECQFYDFSTSDVVSRICEGLTTIIEGMMNSLSKKLTGLIEQNNIDMTLELFLKNYAESLKTHRPQLETIVNNFLSINKNVLLNIDKCQFVQYTEKEEDQTMRELEEAKCKFRAVETLEQDLLVCLKSIANEQVLLKNIESHLGGAESFKSDLIAISETTNQAIKLTDICNQLNDKLKIKE